MFIGIVNFKHLNRPLRTEMVGLFSTVELAQQGCDQFLKNMAQGLPCFPQWAKVKELVIDQVREETFLTDGYPGVGVSQRTAIKPSKWEHAEWEVL